MFWHWARRLRWGLSLVIRIKRAGPQGAYVLRNQREFFAMTASAYLNGTVARPPYNRETIRENQPAYYAYLARLFGPR